MNIGNIKIKLSLYIFIFIITLFYKTNILFADYEEYNLTDFVYFDPVTENKCDERNYWTIYNQNTTCYRFIVLEHSDSNNENVKIMLDHNIAKVKYEDHFEVLSGISNKWTRYNGTVDIITEDKVLQLLKISSRPNEPNMSVIGGYSYFTINSVYTYNKTSTNHYGFWTKDTYNNDYVYTITEGANNRIITKNDIRGVRPVLTINKNLLNKFKNNYYLTLETPEYSYAGIYINPLYYTQLQGFTITNDKIVFYATNGSDKDGGYLSMASYENKETNDYSFKYTNAGHGNDMTYNSNDNTILIVGPNNYKTIYKYDALNNNQINELAYNSGASAIGYDAKTDFYATAYGNMIDILKINNELIEKIYSFSFPHNEDSQGLEYNNGYVYVTTYKSSNDGYQDYSPQQEHSAVIYVYNARFNKINNVYIPSKAFGKLVKKIYIDVLSYEKSSNIYYGEIESISFHNNKVYLGYATPYDTNYAYKFYEFNENELVVSPPSGDFNNDKLVNINDAEMIATHIIDKSELSEEKYNNSDIDEDGKIKMNDVMLLIKTLQEH